MVTISAAPHRDGGLAHRVDATLRPDQARVLPQLFLPGEEFEVTRSRSDGVIRRILALPEDEVEVLVGDLIARGSTRHYDYTEMLLEHAATVRAHISNAGEVSPARQLLIGASFTGEVAVEGGALCNPSAVPHPDQSGLADGELRLAVSVRGIAEGHISSIGFATAVVNPGPEWEWAPRATPITSPTVTEASWSREHLRRILDESNRLDEFACAVLDRLGTKLSRNEFDGALVTAQAGPYGARRIIETTAVMHTVLLSGYAATFPPETTLDQRVLFPHSPEESKGIEDARFVLFTDDDGTQTYRATYTAYDGRAIAPRLIVSADLRTFRTQRFAGSAAVNKGMALFPRRIDGHFMTLCRSDGETISLASSDDGVVWDSAVAIHPPALEWELLQVGNCGPPLETEHGWLVLTHGVGPMRTYSIGALLLDLRNPARVLRRLTTPLLRPLPTETEGYVPHVVYSCGGIIHNGVLWIPYGIGDARIGVAWVDVDAVVERMEPVHE